MLTHSAAPSLRFWHARIITECSRIWAANKKGCLSVVGVCVEGTMAVEMNSERVSVVGVECLMEWRVEREWGETDKETEHKFQEASHGRSSSWPWIMTQLSAAPYSLPVRCFRYSAITHACDWSWLQRSVWLATVLMASIVIVVMQTSSVGSPATSTIYRLSIVCECCKYTRWLPALSLSSQANDWCNRIRRNAKEPKRCERFMLK